MRKVVKFYDLIAKLLKITSPFVGRELKLLLPLPLPVLLLPQAAAPQSFKYQNEALNDAPTRLTLALAMTDSVGYLLCTFAKYGAYPGPRDLPAIFPHSVPFFVTPRK